MKYYMLTETQLIGLLADYHKLAALENGGVDNWEGYGWSIGEYLSIDNEEDFTECAVNDLKDYKTIEVDEG